MHDNLRTTHTLPAVCGVSAVYLEAQLLSATNLVSGIGVDFDCCDDDNVPLSRDHTERFGPAGKLRLARQPIVCVTRRVAADAVGVMQETVPALQKLDR